GLPLKTVLEQLDILGEEVVPVLREEFAKGRGADVPEAPTHQSLLAAQNTRNTQNTQNTENAESAESAQDVREKKEESSV
ncbi:5,10-methylene tetrahydromethanopterin reductase, partial [Streptomyces olivaceoviridis]